MPALIHRADNTRRATTEDSPARIVIAFDGDRSKLPLEERLFADQFRMFTKQEFPYAILMYIWENRAPVGTVIENLHTSRIRMVVADSGDANLGTWREETRNLYEDYRRVREEPGPIRSVAIMTGETPTGEEAEAFYGDIAFTATFRREGIALSGVRRNAAHGGVRCWNESRCVRRAAVLAR